MLTFFLKNSEIHYGKSNIESQNGRVSVPWIIKSKKRHSLSVTICLQTWKRRRHLLWICCSSVLLSGSYIVLPNIYSQTHRDNNITAGVYSHLRKMRRWMFIMAGLRLQESHAQMCNWRINKYGCWFITVDNIQTVFQTGEKVHLIKSSPENTIVGYSLRMSKSEFMKAL